jgi:N-acetylglucosaminyldiphosphoundecaprenol N-acetyl-beta-D-mannosaminyltransferase
MVAQQNRRFARVLNSAALSVPDGVGLRWACRLAGKPIRQVVHGVDLVERLARFGSKRGWRFFLLGAREGIAAKAAEVLTARYPGLIVSGSYSGSSDEADDAEAVARVLLAGRPDVLLVAFGAPKQELWIERNRDALGVPLAIGVGGSFDYISGDVQRAPTWIVRLGFEWLYRLIHQPWRWRRQTSLIRFVLKVVSRHILKKDAVTYASRPYG